MFMLIRLIARPGLSLIARGRCSSRCYTSMALQQPSNRMCSWSTSKACRISVVGIPVSVSSVRTQWQCRSTDTASADAAAAEVDSSDVGSSSIEAEDDCASVVSKARFEPDYLNFFALTGFLERPMASCRTPNGGFEFNITVYDGKRPGQSFEVVAADDAVDGISNSLDQLPQGVLLSVEGKLATPREAYSRTGIKVLARFVGVIDDVPGHIAAAAAMWTADGTADGIAAAAVLTPGEGGMPEFARDDTELLWMNLFVNPGSYYDNRTQKVGRQPDFKCRSDGQPLWIEDSRTPAWVLQNLQLLPGNLPYTGSRKGAWRFEFLPQQAGSDTEAEWMDLFNYYQMWWDNRMHKHNPKQPDFKHKRNGDRALWIRDHRTPRWAIENLDQALPPPPVKQ